MGEREQRRLDLKIFWEIRRRQLRKIVASIKRQSCTEDCLGETASTPCLGKTANNVDPVSSLSLFLIFGGGGVGVRGVGLGGEGGQRRPHLKIFLEIRRLP